MVDSSLPPSMTPEGTRRRGRRDVALRRRDRSEGLNSLFEPSLRCGRPASTLRRARSGAAAASAALCPRGRHGVPCRSSSRGGFDPYEAYAGRRATSFSVVAVVHGAQACQLRRGGAHRQDTQGGRRGGARPAQHARLAGQARPRLLVRRLERARRERGMRGRQGVRHRAARRLTDAESIACATRGCCRCRPLPRRGRRRASRSSVAAKWARPSWAAG